MDYTLRCNSLECRKELNDHAVVTTCSHIFCIDCSNRCQLAGQNESRRVVCPACDMQLTNPDDVVVTRLNPTEDYKTSVLSGLSPSIIMECAGRAMSFWAYQTTQEIVYQGYLAKNLTDKYSALSMQVDKLVHDANSEITALQNKLSSLQLDQENLRRKNEELAQAFREKSRKHLQTQELYDKLKRREMLGQVQHAASCAAENNVQALATGGSVIENTAGLSQVRDMSTPLPNPHRNVPMFPINPPETISMVNQRNQELGKGVETWGRFGKENIRQNRPIETPSSHRRPLGATTYPGLEHTQQSNPARAMQSQRRSTPNRPPLGGQINSGSAMPGLAGYGMSAGVKVSNPVGTSVGGFARPTIRSRVAQRPGSVPNMHSTMYNMQTSNNGQPIQKFYH
ncbi:cyclin B1 interacting protein-like protein 1 [Xylogone sp. PMI_703]|nr:cyclin B1 interacting protein-like protein 1 [Xylogone sp. PMI_703]